MNIISDLFYNEMKTMWKKVAVKNNAVEEINEAEITKPNETKQDFVSKVATKPVWRLHVVAKWNWGSFNKWEEYEISEGVFNLHNGLFEILDD